MRGPRITPLRDVCPTQLLQNLFTNRLHAPSVRGDGVVGDFGIQGRPSQHELLELLFRIRTVQQAAGPRMPRPFDLLVDGSPYIDDDAARGNSAPLVEAGSGATARCRTE